MPENFKGTFIERQVNDEVSMSYPYAAPSFRYGGKAGIYHTNPEFVYLPEQNALDSFNIEFAGKVYLFEQRLKGDWSNADNLGNFKEFFDTYEVMNKLQDETENHVDQEEYIKARLFDMLIADWDRHEDQWGWGEVKKGNQKIFIPVPQDRDQAFFAHHGKLLDVAIYASGIRLFPEFQGSYKSMLQTLNYEERGIDRVFTNELTKTQWIDLAKELQSKLTDNVIEAALKKLPPEVFPFSAKKINRDLKSRRDQLVNYAIQYYLFLSKEVEIIGTKGT